MAYKTHQGYYNPVNPEKWIITSTSLDKGKIRYRSGWERKFMVWADKNPNVLEVNSEGVIIPYTSPLDGKQHRYYMDFYIKIRDKNGDIKRKLIEVKPFKETKPPSKRSKHYQKQMKTYVVNMAKWEATQKACAGQADLSFQIITEKELGV